MKVIREIDLCDFEFWAGAKDFTQQLTDEELDLIEATLEDVYCKEAPSETDINDFFWFRQEQICEWLGLDWDEVMEREWE